MNKKIIQKIFSNLKNWKPFLRAQASSLLATLVDYGTVVMWISVLKFHYAFGVVLGPILGGVTNFLVNRYWSFEAANSHEKKHSVKNQAVRYALVSGGSLLLNVGLTLAIVKFFELNVYYTKIAVSLSVGFFYNYPLQRYFVYQKAAT